MTETSILCFLLIGEINEVSLDETKYFKNEIGNLLDRENWADFPNVNTEINNWYRDLVLAKNN